MKTFRIILPVFLMGFLVVSCEKENLNPALDLSDQKTKFIVPDIPEDIAVLMSDEDIALFKAGPGEIYLEESALKSTRRKCGRWHPVLMLLEYNLQIWPMASCSSWSGPPSFPLTFQPMGAGGKTWAYGSWLFTPVYSEYYPVFCFPDYSGHGQGFHETDKGMLRLTGENTPFQIDDQGNSTFRRTGQYLGAQSTGIFEGARGWEVMVSYTAAENSPSNNPTGQGLSQTIAFGWVYY